MPRPQTQLPIHMLTCCRAGTPRIWIWQASTTCTTVPTSPGTASRQRTARDLNSWSKTCCRNCSVSARSSSGTRSCWCRRMSWSRTTSPSCAWSSGPESSSSTCLVSLPHAHILHARALLVANRGASVSYFTCSAAGFVATACTMRSCMQYAAADRIRMYLCAPSGTNPESCQRLGSGRCAAKGC